MLLLSVLRFLREVVVHGNSGRLGVALIVIGTVGAGVVVVVGPPLTIIEVSHLRYKVDILPLGGLNSIFVLKLS